MEKDDIANVFNCASKNEASSLTSFKKPAIVTGKRPGLIRLSGTNCKQKLITHTTDARVESKGPDESVHDTTPAFKEDLGTCYNPPPSSCFCPFPYKVEVLKQGIITQVEDVGSSTKSFCVFGRLPSCDVVLHHPSISRYHAVLQYKMDDNEGTGWYLFDLGSTHGTYLNKKQIPPKVYCRLRSGHIFRLGASTRLFILQGPEDDQEPISELSVTQLKELKQRKLEEMSHLENEELAEGFDHISVFSNSGSPLAHSGGIDWGLGEDAKEENPFAENPYALPEEAMGNESLYLDDPKKTLRGWFEREGYELEYKIEEKSCAHFICRIELPIELSNGAPVIAEASVRGGKKKEAVVQCALEACRILDRHGLLRQSNHESKTRSKRKKCDEDYYSSDEDSFLDRTGTAERKRRERIKGKANCVETYESLMQQYNDTEKEILQIQQALTDKTVSNRTLTDIHVEDVDAYIQQLQSEEPRNNKSRAVLRLQLTQLQREKSRLIALLKVVQPNKLSTLTSVATSETIDRVASTETVVQQNNLKKGSVGVIVTSDIKSHPGSTSTPLSESSSLGNSVVQSKNNGVMPREADNAPSSSILKEDVEHDAKKVGLVIRKCKKGISDYSKKKVEPKKGIELEYNAYDEAKYSIWIPPDNQSGDGKNSLNTKYGY